MVGGKVLEEVEQDARQLFGSRKQQTVGAVADSLSEGRPVVESADRHAGTEEIRDFHRDVEAGRRAMEAETEVCAADHPWIILGLEPPGAQVHATGRQAGKPALKLNAPGAVAGNQDRQIG